MSHKNILRIVSSVALLLLFIGLVAKNKVKSFNFVAAKPQFSEIGLTKAVAQVNKIEKQLTSANNQFGFELFNHIFNPTQRQNVFISPTSIAIALAMTYNGANGETQKAMASALNLTELNLKDINVSYQKLQQNWQKAESPVQLSIANSLWAKVGVPFKHKFLKNNREYYSAQITNLNFANPGAKNIINSWVKEATQGKIERIVNNINPENILLLINAIYFKGTWANQFDRNLTTAQSFYLSDNFSKPHPLMSQTGKYRYYENDRFQAVSLPYEGNQLSMYIFLPRAESDLATFSRQLTFQNWQQWSQQFRPTEGTVKIPRFQLEYDVNLNRALTALGMGIVFEDKRADFSGMTSQLVFIDRVKHKTFVEVNEEGTEAAGVTSVGISTTSVNLAQPFAMIVNRPFFCAIADERTGTILFMGSILDPS